MIVSLMVVTIFALVVITVVPEPELELVNKYTSILSYNVCASC